MLASYALLFPGQGVQYVGMGAALVKSFACARQVFEQADDTLGLPLSTLCFEGPRERLDDTSWAQPAVFTASIAALAVVQEAAGARLRPAAVAGHSLGEYSALVAAEAIGFADALRLVRARGIAMRDAALTTPGGMLAIVGLATQAVQSLCEDVSQSPDRVVELANDNCPGQIVVAGHLPALEDIAERAEEAGAVRVVRLNVSAACHSALMQPARESLEVEINASAICAPSIPVIGNARADWLVSTASIKSELLNQLTSTLRWHDSMRLVCTVADTVIELGPGDVLSRTMRWINTSVRRVSFGDDPQSLPQLMSILRG